ncbi:MAG TPA: Rne/Rng family ribonuclease [Actinomycetota bacterium]
MSEESKDGAQETRSSAKPKDPDQGESTPQAAPNPPRAPGAPRAPSGQGPAAGESAAGESAADGTPRPRRRRGKRGGRRHRKPGTTTATPASESGTEAEPAAKKTTAARSPSPSRSRSATPRARTTPAGASKASAPAEDGAPPAQAAATEGAATEAAANGEAKPAAARKRRGSRGGRGRSRSGGAAKPAADGEAAPPDKAEKPAKKTGRAAPASTRLAARQLRSQQRGRRPRKRLTEEEAAALRGGEKVMLVHSHEDRTQIAVMEEGDLIEHFVARAGQRTSMAGNIYLGRVQNVLPGMEAAFIDFGRGRNGVLYAGEVNYSPEDLEGDRSHRIEHVLKQGQSLMVQVTKDPIGSKGARLTTQLSIAGRFLVLAPEQDLTGISRRLAENERARLRQILRDIRPAGHGVIIRTAADGASKEALERDLNNLLKIWEETRKTAKKAKAPHPLYEEPELTMKVVRDIFSGGFGKVIVDARRVYEDIRGYLKETAPELIDKVELHEGALPIFEEHRVTEQLHKALERKVWLPSGGSIIIERTEALTVIDVNTGKFTGKGTNLEETVFQNNLEAADEVARQLRLRDIGGIIVIDFIDMIDTNHQKELLRSLKRALSRDKTRSQVFEVSNLGLVEMTRKKVSEGLLDAFSEPCPNCEGRGIVMTHDID